MSIREALLSVEGEDAPSIQPIIDALSGLGFDERKPARGSFSVLQADQVAGLTVAQRCTLQAAVQAVAAGRGAGSATGAGANTFNDTTATYLKACLPAFDAHQLWGSASQLRLLLAETITPGLPLPAPAAARLFQQRAELEGPLVSTAASAAAASADDLSAHVRHVMLGMKPCVGSEMYTAKTTSIVVEDTLRLIAERQPEAMHIHMDRNTTDASEATIKSLRPGFMCWVNGALVLKGEEKAHSRQLEAAIKELTTKMSTAWAAGLVPDKRPPCMLAFAAAGTLLQFFCIQPPESDGDRVQATPISAVLDLTTALGRLRALTASCNIWRLLAGYASQAPTVPLESGHIMRSPDGLRTCCLLQGFFRKSIANFATEQAPFASFELLQDVYSQMSKPEHRRHIIQVYDIEGHAGPQLLNDVYTVHVAPVGVPCQGAPADLRTLARAVSGVLRGLAALHSEGFVHRDVRWANVIFLPAERRWLLIDLEHAGLHDCDCSGAPYPLQHWSHRTLDAGGKYTFRSDLRMLAEQLLCWVELDEGGRDLRQQLLSGQLTAAAALEHEWLVGSGLE
ncbi:hypothetical protein CHLRE_10g465000v5 [Chlamydomonas reinhardtii]|uniref:Protein kinase domain-containing protein n=1 Tax=Chlamydomonas reinhardtii TaxID=3055 RepID=A0A2K3DC66_CHLRE|nr:uncharacterized protein CHLRE_10g465000v5 [Chlamydomonas reinhardtii]PNW78119.1 hypothetical protein CHLRE_10g465000v5 [Chlamydomonas reinhardtii]